MTQRNARLNTAKINKNDEFYTNYHDIKRELVAYRKHFAGKVVYCNCDNPDTSNFTKFFLDNFKHYGIKRLISTRYQPTDLFNPYAQADILVVDANHSNRYTLRGDGDFRSAECVDLLKQADIVVTNPPFSLFREYVPLLLKHKKQFLILGNVNAIKFHCIFSHIQSGEVWLGYSGGVNTFDTPNKEIAAVNTYWFTNMDHGQRPEPLELTERYVDDPARYPKYDNCDAINVDNIKDIPLDYRGVMGVPITFLVKYCPDQFEIVTATCTWSRNIWRTKVYPNSTIIVGDTGKRLSARPRGDCSPVLKFRDRPTKGTYFALDGAYYKVVYSRVLIRHR